MKFAIPARYVLVIMCFCGLFCAYSLRVNVNVAIVAMVKDPLVYDRPNSNQSLAACPELVPKLKTFNSSVEDPSHKGNGEFEWNSNLQGLVLGSFYYGYFITQIPGGIIAEKFGAKWIFGVGILITALLSLLIPFLAKWNVWSLIIARVIQGLGEGVTYPGLYSLIGRWATKQELCRLSAITSSGAYVGIVVSLYVSGMLCESNFLGGWPSTFYTFGVLGCIWFVLWAFLVYDSPLTHPWISKEELAYIQRGRLRDDENELQKTPIPWKSIFTSSCIWGLIITHIGENWGFYTLLTDLPTYLANVLHYDIGTNGILSAVSNLLPALFTVFSSIIADKLLENGRLTTTTIRKLMNSIGLYVPSLCLIIIAFIECQPVVILVCLAIAVGTNGFTMSGFLVTHVNIAPEFAGTLMGITNCFASLPGFLAPSVVGYLIQDGNTLENWRKVFILTSVIFFVSGTTYNIVCSSERLFWGSNQESEKKLKETEHFKNSNEPPCTLSN